MGHQPKDKPATGAVQTIKTNDFTQVIYADRIINAGFGPGVSRLTLAMETGMGVFTPTATLVLPTPALLEAMSAVLNAIQGNAELKEGILKGLDVLKEQISALK